MLIAAAIGAIVNSISNAGQIHSWGAFFKYAGIGAVSGAMGYNRLICTGRRLMGSGVWRRYLSVDRWHYNLDEQWF